MRAKRTLGIVAGGVLATLTVSVLPGGCADGTSLSTLLNTLTSDLNAWTEQQSATTDSTDVAAATAEVQTDENGTAADAQSDPNSDGSVTPADDAAASLPGDPPGPGMGCHGPRLTAEQRAALAALQAALDAGEIAQDEFCQQVHDLLGDPPCGPPLPPINLTDEQISQAQAIFQQAHDQIVALHETARADVLAQLTAEQQQTLADMQEPNAPPEGQGPPFIALCPPPENAACARPVRVPLPSCPPLGAALGQDGGMPPGPSMGRGPHGPGPHGPRPLCLSAETIATLGLSAEQVTAITAVHDTLRTATQQVRDDARAAFRAILTEEQLQALDQLPPPPGGPHPPQ